MNVNSLSKCFISLNEIWCQKKGNLVKKKKNLACNTDKTVIK